MNSHQNGNVLFLILVAVALFAALSYAVTSSTRSGGGSVSKDKAKANAALIVQHGTAIRNAVMRVKLSGNCTDTTLDFSNEIYKKTDEARTNTINANAPSSCYIYSANGGNIIPLVPSIDALGDLSVPNVGVGA